MTVYSEDIVKAAFKRFVAHSNKETFKIVYDNGTIIDYHISLNYSIENHTLINNADNPLLKISNTEIFIKKLTSLLNTMAQYHSSDKDYYDFNDRNFLNYLLVSCFSNMTEYDFNNPLSYFDRMTDAYNQSYIFGTQKVGEITIKDKKIQIEEITSKNIATMESPLYKRYRFSFNNEFFYSPKIHYYISKEKCYITAIQNSSKKQDSNLAKLMDRYFRKLDKGLDNIERSSNGQIETIKDISPNALAALVFFVSSTKTSNVLFPDLLPLRYSNKAGSLKNKCTDENEADRIQSNLTNKLLFTGIRLCYHFKFSDYSFDIPSFLEIEFDPSTIIKDNIVFDIYNSVQTPKKIK